MLPIPPGTHWSDAKPMVVPGAPPMENPALPESETGAAKPKPKRERPPKPKVKVPATIPLSVSNGLRFGPLPEIKPAASSKPKRERPAKQKINPAHIAKARELRDRYLDEVNSGMLLPSAEGKYDVSRQLAASDATPVESLRLLDAA